MRSKQKTIKYISGLLIVFILLPSFLFSAPKKAEAIPVVDAVNAVFNKLTSFFTGSGSASTAVNTSISIKNAAIEIGKQLLKVLAKRVLAEMTKSTINWINNGFHGKPLFLENPDSFFKNIAKTQVKSLVDLIGYDTFKFPFGKQTALNVIDSYKSQFATNAQYSLSKVINDPELLLQYRNDFNYGGWNGFLINTQYPQNNYLGFNMIVEQNIASRLEGTIQAPAKKVQDALQYSMGFLSPQTCPSNDKYPKSTNPHNPPTWDDAAYASKNPYKPPAIAAGETYAHYVDDTLPRYDNDWKNAKIEEKNKWSETNACPGGLVSTTPGAVVANQIFSATNTPFLTTALDGALGNSLAAIFDALLNKLIGDGLTSLKTTINPASETDNWNYYGNTLSGGGSSGNNNTWDYNANTKSTGGITVSLQAVSVKIGQTKIVTIGGGNGDYGIQTETDDTIAVAVLSGNGIVISGVSKGTTFIEIKDSAGSANKKVDITVITPEELSLSMDSVSIDVEPVYVTISGGKGPFTAEILSDEDGEKIAKATVEGSRIRILGLKVGQSSFIVKDSSYPPQATGGSVTVITPSEPEEPATTTGTTTGTTGTNQGTTTTIDPLQTPGTCTKPDHTTIKNVTQWACQTTLGGASWAPLVCSSVSPKGTTDPMSPSVVEYIYGVSSNVSSVKFATWSEAGGQDDLVWYEAKKYPLNPSTWTYEVNLSSHDTTASNKKIIFHAYMYSSEYTAGIFCEDGYFFNN